MREKLKSVLHRRKRSTPTQSPRGSYERSEEGSPRAEQHSASSRRHNRSRSSASHSASSPVDRAQHPKTPRKSGSVRQSASSPSDSDYSGQSNDAKIDEPVSHGNSSHRPVLAPDEDLIVEGSNTDNYRSFCYSDRLGNPSNIRHSTNGDLGDREKEPIGTAVTTNGSYTEEALLHNGEYQNVEELQSSASERHNDVDMTVKPPDFDSKRDYSGMDVGNEWKARQKSMLKGVVDLSNTVDTDRETTWAPAVTHEVIKPHEHEVVQHKIFREIHNYTYYHRLQPVMQTEVLPPRHFIPNPDGEGLIEISADELPTRTGKNRWWDIVQKVPELPQAPFQWRTEPQVIEGKPYMTEEGFERRETTIIYPPTLQDMSSYSGLVQPVHFDHKTGERWLGEITTVDKLKQELASTSDEEFMSMKEVKADLPEVPPRSSVKRKPVGQGSI